MLDILTTFDEIELLPNGTLALFKDTNDSLCLVLKEKYFMDFSDIKLFYYCVNKTHNIIVKIFNTIYKIELVANKANSILFKKLKRKKNVNIFFFSKEQEKHIIHNTFFNTLRGNKNLIKLKDKDQLWNYIQKKRKLFF